MSCSAKGFLSRRWAIVTAVCLICSLPVHSDPASPDGGEVREGALEEGGDDLHWSYDERPATITLEPLTVSEVEENLNEGQEDGGPDLSAPYNSFLEHDHWAKSLWGRPARDHIYLGMWTLHFSHGEDQENENQLIGATWKGYYGGTFINTHGDRVWTAGWQRTLFQQRYGDIEIEAGYRAGMMYGYTKYLQLFDTRWYPLVQTVLDIDYKNFGVQFSWAGVVLTAGFFYRF